MIDLNAAESSKSIAKTLRKKRRCAPRPRGLRLPKGTDRGQNKFTDFLPTDRCLKLIKMQHNYIGIHCTPISFCNITTFLRNQSVYILDVYAIFKMQRHS